MRYVQTYHTRLSEYNLSEVDKIIYWSSPGPLSKHIEEQNVF